MKDRPHPFCPDSCNFLQDQPVSVCYGDCNHASDVLMDQPVQIKGCNGYENARIVGRNDMFFYIRRENGNMSMVSRDSKLIK